MSKLLEPGAVATPLIREMGYSQECSCCAGQYAKLRYIDFDASHDGGWYGGDALITKDDLVLCENCIREAAVLIDMVDGEQMKAELEHQETQIEMLTKRAEKAENYADRLEESLTKLREKPVRIDHRVKPRQVA